IQRLMRVINTEGTRYLATPRDVVRVLNSLRLHAIPVRKYVDIPDIVWLHLVRFGNPDLYSWTEEYLTKVAAIYGGPPISTDDADRMGRRLDQIFANEGRDKNVARLYLSEILPGISTESDFGQDRKAHFVFDDLSRDKLRAFVSEKRLGSPDHYR